MSWTCTINGHSDTVTASEVETAIRKVFAELVKVGATYAVGGGMTGGESVSFVVRPEGPSAEPKTE